MRRPGLRFMATTTGVVVAATLALAVSLLAGPAPVVAQSASGAAPSGAAALRLDYDHLVLGAAGDRLTVREAVGLNNAGPSGLSRIVLPLPTGYADLKLESGFAGGKAAAETGNLVDTSGLAGGAQREVVFSYSLPLSAAKTAGFAKRLDYVTGALSITAEARSIRLAGSRGLTALTSELNGVAYNRLKAGNVPAGTSFDVEVTVGSFSTASAPPPGAGTAAVGKAGRLLNRSIHGGPDNVMLWQRFTGRPGHWGLPGIIIILGLIVVGLGAVGKAAIGLRRSRPAPAVQTPLGLRRAQLVGEIAALDRQFELGQVGETDYRATRSALKQELMVLVGRGKGEWS